MTPEQRAAAQQQAWARMTPEQRAAAQQRAAQQRAARQRQYQQHAQQVDQTAQQYSRSNYAGMRPADPHQYTVAARNAAKRQPRSKAPRIVGGIVALAVIVAAVVFIFFPPFYEVSINGITHRVNAGATFQDAINAGYASPKAGNLMAIDGSVAKEGGGEPFQATYEGTTTSDLKALLPRGAQITISNGGDTTETYTETTETVPFETRDLPTSNAAYYEGSIHIYSDGENGEQTTKIGDVSGARISEVTKQPVPAGYRGYTVDTGGEKVIALTFDDGPWHTTTKEIIDLLAEYNAHATFFVIGNQVEENPDLVREAHDNGNQIATHTYDHAAGSGKGVNLTYMSSDEQVQEITKGLEAVDNALGTQVSRVLRTPGGNYYGPLITTLHPYIDAEIGWDVDTRDWSKPGAEKIAEALKSVKPGQVVLMHDGGGDRSQTVEGLRTALPYLAQQGYKFITIDELMKYPEGASA